jgi:uncharacterized SAM-binding protein YcdF (DUF218 family)
MESASVCSGERRFDAVVALDGDRPRRLRAAVALASQGTASALVIVRGEDVAPELVAARDLPFEVISFVPDPSSTRGEARAVARLAAECGWRSVLAVTSSYHVPRTRLIFARALKCDFEVLSSGCSARRLPRDLAAETVKWIVALTVRRGP